MYKVVLDTNVFISGLLFGGNPGKILESWIQKDFTLCISPALKSEIINKLRYKFSAGNEYIVSISKIIDNYSEKYIPQNHIKICEDENDNFLFDLAQEATADLIVSGDKKVLEIKQYEEIKVISPKEFLVLLEKH